MNTLNDIPDEIRNVVELYYAGNSDHALDECDQLIVQRKDWGALLHRVKEVLLNPPMSIQEAYRRILHVKRTLSLDNDILANFSLEDILPAIDDDDDLGFSLDIVVDEDSGLPDLILKDFTPEPKSTHPSLQSLLPSRPTTPLSVPSPLDRRKDATTGLFTDYEYQEPKPTHPSLQSLLPSRPTTPLSAPGPLDKRKDATTGLFTDHDPHQAVTGQRLTPVKQADFLQSPVYADRQSSATGRQDLLQGLQEAMVDRQTAPTNKDLSPDSTSEMAYGSTSFLLGGDVSTPARPLSLVEVSSSVPSQYQLTAVKLSLDERVANYRAALNDVKFSPTPRAIETLKLMEDSLMEDAKEYLKPLHRTPQLAMSLKDLQTNVALEAHEGFVLSLIDGFTSLAEMAMLASMPEDKLYLILLKFELQGIFRYT